MPLLFLWARHCQVLLDDRDETDRVPILLGPNIEVGRKDTKIRKGRVSGPLYATCIVHTIKTRRKSDPTWAEDGRLHGGGKI
jgi:hypothetical protein